MFLSNEDGKYNEAGKYDLIINEYYSIQTKNILGSSKTIKLTEYHLICSIDLLNANKASNIERLFKCFRITWIRTNLYDSNGDVFDIRKIPQQPYLRVNNRQSQWKGHSKTYENKKRNGSQLPFGILEKNRIDFDDV